MIAGGAAALTRLWIATNTPSVVFVLGPDASITVGARRGMDYLQRARTEAVQLERGPEIGVVRIVVEVGGFDHGNHLPLSGIARIVDGREVIDRRQIARRHRIASLAAARCRVRGPRPLGVAGMEVIQRDDTLDRRRQRGGNLRI